MATDVDVQFFSHLNGLVLGNNWGDMIALLDTCLVNGLALSVVTAATVDSNGDLTLTLFANHNCLLFQIVELTGFAPSNINGKYRIKGTPNSKTMVLKATLAGQNISTVGTAKLAPLGYDIAFTGTNKRAYRAKNPTSQHPFIRVDETISDGANSYTSTYAKYAMVGLIENMTHIDDYLDPNKLQLPLDTTDFSKNWKITGTGTNVVRGWCRWYWSRFASAYDENADTNAPAAGARPFTLCGDQDAFYINVAMTTNDNQKKVTYGAGIYDAAHQTNMAPPWFLIALNTTASASTSMDFSSPPSNTYGTCFGYGAYTSSSSQFSVCDIWNKIVPHLKAIPFWCNATGVGALNGSNVSAMQIPFWDSTNAPRGTLKHIAWCGNKQPSSLTTTSVLSDSDMYVQDAIMATVNQGAFYYYMGEIE